MAAGVVLLALATIASRQLWLAALLAAGFWARVATGPTLSPLGQLATRVVAPRLGAPKPVPGPPKRFAQGVGVVFSTTALVLWAAFGQRTAGLALLGLLAAAAFLESAFAVCLGCRVFAGLMRLGIIPAGVCEECADLSRRHPDLRPAR